MVASASGFGAAGQRDALARTARARLIRTSNVPETSGVGSLASERSAVGFEIEALVTEPIAEFEMNGPMWNFLEDHGYNTSLRGEQTYCVAVKRSGLQVTRYPRFLYSE